MQRFYVIKVDFLFRFKIIFKDLPLGQLPILKIDGETYAQSVAIMRFAAAQAGLPALNPVQELRSNMLVDTMTEIFDKTVGPAFAAANSGPAEGKLLIIIITYYFVKNVFYDRSFR